MEIIDGKFYSNQILEEIAKRVEKMDKPPSLAVILVGDDPASHLYVKIKERACKQTGIIFHKYLVENFVSKEEILEMIKFLNNDEEIDGILVQLPLPNREWENEIIQTIDPKKDVDGFHPKTIKNLLKQKSIIAPGLPAGIVYLLKTLPFDLQGKECIILCNSEIFSQPLKFLLEQEGIICDIVFSKDLHKFDLKTELSKYDIVISAVGKPEFIKGYMLKPDAVVIDVGINKKGEKKVVGDVDFNSCKDNTGYITPVPGGVGPMTVAMLMFNVWKVKQNKVH